MKKSLFKLSVVLSLVLCLTAGALAQRTTGDIEGTVTDPKGAIVPGVSVTVTGTTVGFNRTVTSDADGKFRFPQVPAGSYKIDTAATSGFAETTLDTIVVNIEKITTADVVLGVAQSVNTVDVSSDPLGVNVDTTDSKVQTNVTSQLIDALPKGTSFSSLLKVSPGTRSEPLSGGFQVDGASGSENSFNIDGQNVSNFRTGMLNAVNNIPTALVQEIQVKTSGFEAEHGGASGGVINVTTKGGSDTWRGEFGMQFESSKLQPGNRFAPSVFQASAAAPQYVYGIRQPRDRFTNTYPTGTFSGPAIKNRLWFLGSVSPQIFPLTRTTNFFNALNSAAFTNPSSTNQAPAGVASGVNLTNSSIYGPQTYVSKTTFQYYFARMDAAILNNLRFSSTFLYNPTEFEGAIPYSVNGIGNTPTNVTINGQSLTSSQFNRQLGGRTNSNNFTAQTIYTPTSNIVLNVRYSHGFLNEKGAAAYGIPPQTLFQCAGLAAATAYTNGSSGCTIGFLNVPTNNLVTKDVSIKNEVNADLSYLVNGFGGRHEFKGGVQYGRAKNDVDNGFKATGQIALQYGRNFDFYGVSAPAGTCILSGVGANCLGVGRLTRFGTQGVASNRYTALFIQDKWQPSSRLTLNLGVRLENENLPAFNVNSGGGSQGQPISFGFGDKVAPRLGAAYDVFGDGKTKIYASYGQFFDRLKFELPRGSFGGDFFRRDYFPILSSQPNYSYYTLPKILGSFTDPVGGGNPSTAGGLSIFQSDLRIPSNLPASVYVAAGLAPAQVVKDLKAFRQDEFTVGFERELSRIFVVSARFTRKNVAHAIEDHAVLGLFESENFYIGNPGEGTDLAADKAAGYAKSAKPQRLYRAFEITFDKRLSNNYFFNVNYTRSKLFGNYSGLASSDENGRTSPGVNRFFDFVINGYTATGDPDNGPLATDRPNTFKSYGGYNFDWFGSKNNTTELSFFQQVLQGTPQTTFINVFATAIPLSKRGDLGRTPTFYQTDLNLSHRYKFGRDSRFTVAFDFNVLNAFNNNSVLGFTTIKFTQVNTISGSDIDPNYDPNTQTLTGVLNRVLNGQIGTQIAGLTRANNPVSVLYGKGNTFKLPVT